jgi:hypothetical protein
VLSILRLRLAADSDALLARRFSLAWLTQFGLTAARAKLYSPLSPIKKNRHAIPQ